MKEKLTASLGTFGAIIWFLVSYLLVFAPLIVLHFPFWVDLILIFIILSVPGLNMVVNVVIWIWAFILTINGPQDAIAIVYYVLFAINVVYVVSTILDSLRRR